jgi:hypothetical protein
MRRSKAVCHSIKSVARSSDWGGMAKAKPKPRAARAQQSETGLGYRDLIVNGET